MDWAPGWKNLESSQQRSKFIICHETESVEIPGMELTEGTPGMELMEGTPGMELMGAKSQDGVHGENCQDGSSVIKYLDEMRPFPIESRPSGYPRFRNAPGSLPQVFKFSVWLRFFFLGGGIRSKVH